MCILETQDLCDPLAVPRWRRLAEEAKKKRIMVHNMRAEERERHIERTSGIEVVRTNEAGHRRKPASGTCVSLCSRFVLTHATEIIDDQRRTHT